MRWVPALDSMYFFNKKNRPTELYGSIATLDGQYIISSKGAFGKGKVDLGRTDISSTALTFQTTQFQGRNARFRVKTDDPKKPALLGKNVRFDYNLKGKIGVIEGEVVGQQSFEFPFSQYRTSISKAVWDVDKDQVTMTKSAASDIEDNVFVSTHPDQFGLYFFAAKAVYDMKDYSLALSGVPEIKVADGRIIPDSGEVAVLRDAEMQPLPNAAIITDTLDQFNSFRKADVSVISRYEFVGEGLYEYVVEEGDTNLVPFFEFSFPEYEKNHPKYERKAARNIYTYSKTIILEEAPLKVAPGILYKGDATMKSYLPNLEMDGFIRFDIKQSANTEWIVYQNDGKERDFTINLSTMRTESGTPLFSGIYLEDGNLDMYSIFVASKRTSQDIPIFEITGTGTLEYEQQLQQFKVGSGNKINGDAYEGNVYTYNDSLSTVAFEGDVNFLSGEERNFAMRSAAIGKADLATKNYEMDALVHMLFNMPTKNWVFMGSRILERVTETGASEANPDQNALLYKLGDIAGNRAAEEYYNASLQQYTPITSIISKLGRGIVISDVDLKWNAREAAWYSVGQLGISNIGQQDINAKVEGYLEIKYAATGQLVTLYLEPVPSSWFFFQYDGEENRLFITSSSRQFNDEIELRSKASKTRTGQYAFAPTEKIERALFVKNFNKVYFGLDVQVQEFEEEDAPLPEIEEENYEGFEDTGEDGGFGEDDGFGDDDGFGAPAKKKKKDKKEDDGFGDPASTDDGGFGDDDGFGAPAKDKDKKKEEPKKDDGFGDDDGFGAPAKDKKEGDDISEEDDFGGSDDSKADKADKKKKGKKKEKKPKEEKKPAEPKPKEEAPAVEDDDGF